MTTIIWEYNNIVVSDPIDLGSFEEQETSQAYEVIIRHDSTREISDCAFYISPFTEEYTGTHSSVKDYERVLWYANNYPGYGVSLIQDYTITGTLDSHTGVRAADFERTEQKDIFSGQNLEILSGEALGEKAVIDRYDTGSQIFILGEDFSTDVTGENYRVAIRDESFFKTGQGSSYNNSIPLISGAGIIERLASASINLKVRVPKFALSAGKHLFNLNMNYTSIEN